MTAVITDFTRNDYHLLIANIETGTPVRQSFLDAGVAFAKAKKIKRPNVNAAVIMDETPEDLPAEPAITPAKKAKAAKTPKAPKDKRCTAERDGERCKKDAVAKGLCAADYAAARRQDPTEREKANAASKAYYARQREAAKAAAEKIAARRAAAEQA